MLANAVLPDRAAGKPPVVLIHGAANSAPVWVHWQAALAERGRASYALDLRGHGSSPPSDLSRTSMQDYADDVIAFARRLVEPPVIIGWSMGGLVAMMAAAAVAARACIGLAPSTPVRERNASKVLRAGEYDATYYGITSADPADQPAMPDLDIEERRAALASLCKESAWARADRAAGIVIERLPCPLLIVTGGADRQWPRERYTDLPLAAEFLQIDEASHWGLVLNRRALATLVPAAVQWLDAGPPGR